MNGDLIQALKQIERERNIPLSVLLEAVESALTSAYRKNYEVGDNVRVEIDLESGGGIRVVGLMTIVKRRKDKTRELSVSQAKKKFKKGEVLGVFLPEEEPEEEKEKTMPEEAAQAQEAADEEEAEVEEEEKKEELQPIPEPTVDMMQPSYRVEVVIEENPKGFGRIAATTTKQVIKQKIREAERDILYEEFAQRQGELISAVVRRQEHQIWICDLGKAEGIIPPHEQVPGEHFRRGERVKAYILNVDKTPRGPQIILSRSHPGLIRKLFELEVPEINQGLIAIENIAREPGARSKVAVRALESNVDPLGACVGPRGSRVQMVVDELRGEKIDIINYTPDPFTYVSNALSPARVLTVTLDPEDRTALVIVPDDQFSLAIGKEGQNARLAAKLTNWKIDIKSESQAREIEKQQMIEKEIRRKKEEERRKLEEEQRKLREEEERRKREEEERKRLEEEEKRRKEEEERRRKEEEERRKREEEERKRKEEEELRMLREYTPQFEPVEELEVLSAPEKDEEKQKEIDEALRHIPRDIPIDQYVAMAYGEEDILEDFYGRGYQEDRAHKKKKKKKKKKKGWDFRY